MGLFSRRSAAGARAESEAQARALAVYAIAASAADGRFDEAECAEMIELASRLEVFRAIKPRDLAAVFKAAWQEVETQGFDKALDDAAAVLPQNLKDMALYVAARVAMADGRFGDREKDFLILVAPRLGIDRERVFELVEDAHQDLPPRARVEPASAAGQKQADTPGFSAYVLLSEPLQFNTAEIRAALLEDYPALDIEEKGQVDIDTDCDTAEIVTGAVLLNQKGRDATVALLSRLPGYGTWDARTLSERQKRLVPDLDARLARNASYICITVSARSERLTDRFRAARLCSCLAALFARLPVALAVYWESADHFLTPELVEAMADEAMENRWPCTSWISLEIEGSRAGEALLTQAMTKGLSSFQPYELVHTYAPVPVQTAAAQVMTASWMVLEGGHSFRDGDTLGREGQQVATSYRIRSVPKERFGAATDLLALVHPNGAFDADAVLGKTASCPAPPGSAVRKRSQPGLFGKLMRGAQRVG